MRKERWLRIIIFIIIIVFCAIAGVLSRKTEFLPDFLNLYAGDTLWAVAAFFLIKIVFIRKTNLTIAVIALSFSFIIEFTQLLHNQWLQQIRTTSIGGLALGYGFHFSDFVCYLTGVVMAFFSAQKIERIKLFNFLARK